jgi:carboxylesterase
VPIMPGAEPYSMGPIDAQVACLAVHGFTGSPYEMRPFAERLAARGVYVDVPLLPGHGTSVEDMSRTSFPDWVAGAEAAYLGLAARHGRTFVLGFSMGGLIALMLAARHRVDGVVVVSAPLRIRDPRARFLPLIALVRKYEPPIPPSPRPTPPSPATAPPPMAAPLAGQSEDDSERRTVSYSQKPVVCIQSLMRLMQAVRAETPRVQAPLLAVCGANDRTAPPEDGQWIIDHAGREAGTDASRDAAVVARHRFVVLENSDHFGMFGPDRDRLLSEVEAFVVG